MPVFNESSTLEPVPGIPGNELADAKVKVAATAASDPLRPISYADAKSLIRRTPTEPLH